MSAGNASFDQDGGSATMKIDMVTIVNGEVQTKTKQDFIKHAQMYGLKAEDLGETFEYYGDTLRIDGLKLRATKNTIKVTDMKNNKPYVVPHDEVVNALKAKRTKAVAA